MRRNRYGYTNLKASDQHCELVLHLRAHDMEYRYIYIYIQGVSKKKSRSLGVQQPRNRQRIDRIQQGSEIMERW